MSLPTDFRQTPAWCQYFESIRWKSERVGNSYTLIRSLPLIGSIIKLHRPLYPLPLAELEELAKKHRALLVKLELDVGLDELEKTRLQQAGYRLDRWPLLATKTVRINLTPPAEELLAGFRSDTRYLIRKAARKGVAVITHRGPNLDHQELKVFSNLMHQLAKPGRFTVPTYEGLLVKVKGFGEDLLFTTAGLRSDLPPATFGNVAGEVRTFQAAGAGSEPSYSRQASHPQQLIAGAVTILHNSTAFLHHLAATPLGRKKFASYAMLWDIIQTAKQAGCTTLDMDGIYDPRDKDRRSWKQFSVFKTKFGGEEIELPMSRTKYFPWWLRLLSKFK